MIYLVNQPRSILNISSQQKTRLSLIQQLLLSRKFYLVGNLQRKKKISPMHAIYLTQVVRKGENILLTTHICIV